MPDPVRELARARVDLRLRVTGWRAGSVAARETLSLRLALADAVELRPGPGGIELGVEAEPPGTAADPGREGVRQGSLFPPGAGEGRRRAGKEGAGPKADVWPRDGEAPEADGAGAADDAGDADGSGTVDGAGSEPAGGESRTPPPDLDDLPSGPDHPCWRAARRFYEATGREPAVSIRLVKRIPAAVGLGDGAAGAAAVLRGLARLHDDPPARAELMEVAGELDGDACFALLDRPMALRWGEGRRLMPLPPPAPRPMLLLVPDAAVAEGDALGWLDERRREAGSDAAEDGGPGDEGGPGGREGPTAAQGRLEMEGPSAALPPPSELARWETLLSLSGNDFETPVFARLPELGWWKEELLGEGAEAVLLCGAGPALCAIFGDARRRDAAADRLRQGTEVRVVETEGPV